MSAPVVAIVDFGLGNLFSVRQACIHSGLEGVITDRAEDLERSDAVILPGVGAFGDAMATLRRLDLVQPLRDAAASGKSLVGICLGLQLLMDGSEEFGSHKGLGIVPGRVELLDRPQLGERILKVPHVGWNRADPAPGGSWDNSLLEGLDPGTLMYFVHSYCVRPSDPDVELCRTDYGDAGFCSGVRLGSVEAFQFHPERSGPQGLRVYANLARRLSGRSRGREG